MRIIYNLCMFFPVMVYSNLRHLPNEQFYALILTAFVYNLAGLLEGRFLNGE